MRRIVFIFAAVFFVVFSVYGIVRMEVWFIFHKDYGYDLTIFCESLSTTLRGEGFFFNHAEYEEFGAWSHFGTHNSPILFLLLPIYALWPAWHTLIILQAFSVSFAAIVLFNLAREVTGDEKKAATISVAYLLNPLTHGIVRYEFHPVVLAVPFMFLFAYYMWKEDVKKAFVAALFVISVKEDSGLFLIAYALFDVIRRHGFRIDLWFRDRRAILFACLGMVWILVSVLFVVPHFNAMHKYPYFSEVYLNNNEYSRVQIFSLALMKLLVLFMSVGFIVLRRPGHILPVLLLWSENAFSGRISQSIIGFHYDYMLLPMVFIILSYVFKDDDRRIVIPAIVSCLLFSPILGIVNLGPLVVNDQFWILLKILLVQR